MSNFRHCAGGITALGALAPLVLAVLTWMPVASASVGLPCPGAVIGRPEPALENPSLLFYLGMDPNGNHGWLDEDGDRSSRGDVTLHDAAGGAHAWVARAAQNAAHAQVPGPNVEPVRFFAAPRAEPVPVNVSSSITGALAYRVNSLHPLANSLANLYAEVDVRLWHNDRVAGHYHLVRDVNTGQGQVDGWYRFGFSFRPEFMVLEPDDTLRLEVSSRGTPQEFTLGFSGEQRSYLNIPALRPDQVFEPNATVAHAPKANTVDSDAPLRDSSAPRLAVAGLLPAGGALFGWFVAREARAPPGRPARGAAILLAILVLSAGCLSIGRKGKAQVAVLNTFEAPSGTLVLAEGKGGLRGQVLEDIGLVISCASVALLKTKHFTKTDSRGWFQFANVTPGQYALRVDKTNFSFYERDLTVVADQVARHDVELLPALARGPGDRPHVHQNWGEDEQERLLFDSDGEDPPLRFNFAPQTPCYGHLRYELGFTLRDVDQRPLLVLPGTSHLSVRIDWTPGTSGVEETGFYYAPANSGAAIFMSPKGPGATTVVPVTPDMADTGHQAWTRWKFGIFLPQEGTQNSPDGEVVRDCNQPEFGVQIVAHRGVVPFEPAHEDWWRGNETITVYDRKVHTLNNLVPLCTNCFQFSPNPPDSNGYAFPRPADKVVGSPAKELRVHFEWQEKFPADVTLDKVRFGLWFRTGDQNPAATSIQEFKRFAPATREGNVTEWILPLNDPDDGKPETPDVSDLDPYYSKSTNWLFYIVDESEAPFGDQPQYDLSFRYNIDFVLSATLVKDDPPTPLTVQDAER